MKKISLCIALIGSISVTGTAVQAQKWTPNLTEQWQPVPELVTPGTSSAPPSDAIVLFDGSNLAAWESINGNAAAWELDDGAMTVMPRTGNLRTRQKFTDIQLHIEWRSPVKVRGEGQGRGNSGVFLQERYEVQVLDSHDNSTYANGQAASVYKQAPPLVNASRPPGEWQSYDIVFRAPVFSVTGKVVRAATITVLHNGVLVQDHVELKGPTEFIGNPSYKVHGAAAIVLQDHGDQVSYRNIWLRELE